MTDTIVEQVTQFGYRTPDGTEVWADEFKLGPLYSTGDITTAKGQAKAQERFRNHLKQSGLPETWGRLEFIQRVRTVSVSPSIPLLVAPAEKAPAPKPQNDDDLDDLVEF